MIAAQTRAVGVGMEGSGDPGSVEEAAPWHLITWLYVGCGAEGEEQSRVIPRVVMGNLGTLWCYLERYPRGKLGEAVREDESRQAELKVPVTINRCDHPTEVA